MKPLIRITTVLFATATLMLSCSTLEKREGGDPVMQGAKEVTVKRDGNRVWIDGAKDLFQKLMDDSEAGRTTPWAERSDTHMYLTRMWIAGWDVDYATLNTVSGYGPSFAYSSGDRGKDYVNYIPPAGRDDRIAHATGCRNIWLQFPDLEDYWHALKQAIDQGQAVHAPNEEDILFIGYEEAEKPEDRRVMPVAAVFVDEDEWTWEQFGEWFGKPMVNGWFGRIEGRVEPWPARESAMEVLRMMVEVANGRDSRRRPGDNVHWGVDGIKAYAADLADMTKSGDDGPGGYFGGGWRG